MLLEVCCFNPCAAVWAIQRNVDRIELCANRDVDGITPAVDDVARVVAWRDQLRSRTKIFVMIRPFPKDPSRPFQIDDAELEEVLGVIRLLPQGVDGLVFGALRYETHADGRGLCATVDIESVQRVTRCAGACGLSVTFHRAFDACVSTVDEAAKAVLLLRTLGVKRILTGGGQWGRAVDHLPVLARLQEVSDQDHETPPLTIIAAGGVTQSQLALLAAHGLREAHGSLLGREMARASCPVCGCHCLVPLFQDRSSL